jgi:hypothetical protein
MAEEGDSDLTYGVPRIIDDQPVGIGEGVAASSNETPCFRTFATAFLGSHSKVRAMVELRGAMIHWVCA